MIAIKGSLENTLFCAYKHNNHIVKNWNYELVRKNGRKILSLPKQENLKVNLSSELKGLLQPISGTKKFNDSLDIFCLQISENNEIVFDRSIILTQTDDLEPETLNVITFITTFKISNLKNNGIKSCPIRVPGSRSSVNEYFNYFLDTNTKELITVLKSPNITASNNVEKTSKKVEIDSYLTLSVTYDKNSKLLTVYCLDELLLSKTLSGTNFAFFDSTNSFGILQEIDSNNGLVSNVFSQDIEYDLLLKSARIYNCELTLDDIKQIMRYDGLI